MMLRLFGNTEHRKEKERTNNNKNSFVKRRKKDEVVLNGDDGRCFSHYLLIEFELPPGRVNGLWRINERCATVERLNEKRSSRESCHVNRVGRPSVDRWAIAEHWVEHRGVRAWHWLDWRSVRPVRRRMDRRLNLRDRRKCSTSFSSPFRLN